MSPFLVTEAQKASAEIAQANAAFGQKLAKALDKSQENLVMSSYSVSSVLSMILLGASGQTQAQLAQGLGLSEERNFQQGYKEILSALKGNGDFTLNAANRVYYSTDTALGQDFIQSVKDYFLAKPVGTNFRKPKEARKAINKWVKSKTSKKIQQLIAEGSISGKTKMVLVNAIYFKGDWDIKFKKSKTRKEYFYVSPDQAVLADMMFINDKFKMNWIKELKGNRIGPKSNHSRQM